jgi:hypothetical protein
MIFLISVFELPINLNFSLVTSDMEKNTKSYTQFVKKLILTKNTRLNVKKIKRTEKDEIRYEIRSNFEQN